MHSAMADADDTNGAPDDEDGVLLPSELIPGRPAAVEVTASGPGTLNAWCDFNTDGDWGDAGEHIFVSIALSAGKNDLSFQVPDTAQADTTTYARFRFSSVMQLSPSGPAPDGEVEDYQVDIASPPPLRGVGELVPNTVGSNITGQQFTLYAKPSGIQSGESYQGIGLKFPDNQAGWGSVTVGTVKRGGITLTEGTHYADPDLGNGMVAVIFDHDTLSAKAPIDDGDNDVLFEIQFAVNTPFTAYSAAACECGLLLNDEPAAFLAAGDAESTAGQDSLDIAVTAGTVGTAIKGSVTDSNAQPISGVTVMAMVSMQMVTSSSSSIREPSSLSRFMPTGTSSGPRRPTTTIRTPGRPR